MEIDLGVKVRSLPVIVNIETDPDESMDDNIGAPEASTSAASDMMIDKVPEEVKSDIDDVQIIFEAEASKVTNAVIWHLPIKYFSEVLIHPIRSKHVFSVINCFAFITSFLSFFKATFGTRTSSRLCLIKLIKENLYLYFIILFFICN